MGYTGGKARRAGTLTFLALCALAIGAVVGCGDGEDDAATEAQVTQRLTTQFGRELVGVQEAPLEGHETALRLLTEYHAVTTVGEGVLAIDDLRPRLSGPEEETWAMNVNGIESDEVAPKYRLYDGDVVQWDMRDWYVTLDVRATVGAFPETFTRGVFGRRFPVTVECEKPGSPPCRQVEGALRRAGVATDGSRPPGGRPPPYQPQRAKVLVGRWRHFGDRPWPHRVDRGPRYSGVFARFTPDARSLRLLDWNGRYVRTAGAGTGLVGALRPTEEDLLWVITGVDDAGVARAARALDSAALRDAFAAAVTPAGVVKLPLPPP